MSDNFAGVTIYTDTSEGNEEEIIDIAVTAETFEEIDEVIEDVANYAAMVNGIVLDNAEENSHSILTKELQIRRIDTNEIMKRVTVGVIPVSEVHEEE